MGLLKNTIKCRAIVKQRDCHGDEWKDFRKNIRVHFKKKNIPISIKAINDYLIAENN